MSRKQAREKAFECLFGQNFSNPKENENLWSFTLQSIDENISPEDKEFITNLCEGVISNAEEIKQILNKALKGYTFDELYQADKTILMLSVFELKYMKENEKIVINEAVNISKKYGLEKSSKFVNGVLSGVLKLDEWKHG